MVERDLVSLHVHRRFDDPFPPSPPLPWGPTAPRGPNTGGAGGRVRHPRSVLVLDKAQGPSPLSPICSPGPPPPPLGGGGRVLKWFNFKDGSPQPLSWRFSDPQSCRVHTHRFQSAPDPPPGILLSIGKVQEETRRRGGGSDSPLPRGKGEGGGRTPPPPRSNNFCPPPTLAGIPSSSPACLFPAPTFLTGGGS